MEPSYDYGLWVMVAFNVMLFGGFAVGFIRPKKKYEWRTMGLFLVTIGMLIQWPTLLTLIMWPILMVAYYRLAMREERKVIKEFPEEYERYRQKVPAFIPSFTR